MYIRIYNIYVSIYIYIYIHIHIHIYIIYLKHKLEKNMRELNKYKKKNYY